MLAMDACAHLDLVLASLCGSTRDRRYAGNVIGIFAAAHDWGVSEPESLICDMFPGLQKEAYFRAAKRKLAGFLKTIDQNLDKYDFATILGACAVAISGRHWGIGYGSFFFALHAYEPRKAEKWSFDKKLTVWHDICT